MMSLALYVIADGTEKPSGYIKDIQVLWHEGTFRVLATVMATGNVHLRPQGKAKIEDAQGQSVSELTFPEGSPAYPGSLRAFAADTKNLTLKPGLYTVFVELQAQGQTLRASRQMKASGPEKFEMVGEVKTPS
jgi:hypothetical protein